MSKLKSDLKKAASYFLPPKILRLRGSKANNAIYLTFDDGPSEGVTDALLDLLKRHNAKATFFVIGDKLQASWDIAQRAVSEGHLIANHSQNHRGFGKLPLEAQLEQFELANQHIANLQQNYRGFRAPQGHWSPKLLWALFRRAIPAIHWSYDSLDYTLDTADSVLARFHREPIRAGEIILFHDDASLCIEALEQLLPQWQSKGFTFRTLESNA